MELLVVTVMNIPCRLYMRSINATVSGMLIEIDAKSLQFMAISHLLYINDGGMIMKYPGTSCETSLKATVKEYIADMSMSSIMM